MHKLLTVGLTDLPEDAYRKSVHLYFAYINHSIISFSYNVVEK